MSHTSGVLDTGPTPPQTTVAVTEGDGGSGITLAYVLPMTVLTICGTLLLLLGKTPVVEVLQLLGGCTALGATFIAVITGGRRVTRITKAFVRGMLDAAGKG
ncbi:hypothetical protein AB0O18_30360 [Streptomyces sp. NPDC093224]|uniref:hypothetical protein n=1 Tax=Streptomyces sp. NPDC093224 TaxID=3155198 RepID=UPI00343D6E36